MSLQNKKTAVVFGGSGFVGSHVADALTEAGLAVRIFDIRPSTFIREGQEMIVGDVMEQEAVEQVVKNADYVYNFCGIANLDDAATRPLDTAKYNVLTAATLTD